MGLAPVRVFFRRGCLIESLTEWWNNTGADGGPV